MGGSKTPEALSEGDGKLVDASAAADVMIWLYIQLVPGTRVQPPDEIAPGPTCFDG